MSDVTATLARAITRAGSKQTYYTARLMVDKDLANDFYRAYAYFRWADDVVDAQVSQKGPPELLRLADDKRHAFIRRQRELIDRLYSGERPDGLLAEEQMLADLIGHDRAGARLPAEASGLQSFVRNMFAVIEFDAYRKGRLASAQELARYTDWLGQAVVDGLQYFIGHGHPYPMTQDRRLAATAAHIAHILRDMVEDVHDGFVNIPREYLERYGIGPMDVESPPYRAWVRERVKQARQDFRKGKRYLDQLAILRCKIVGYWYCARFEGVLDAIERDGYILRARYDERHKLATRLKVAWVAVSVTLRHVARQGFSGTRQSAPKERLR